MKRSILLSGLLVVLQSTALLAQAPPEPALPPDPFVRTPGGSPSAARGEPASVHFLLGVEIFAMSSTEAFSLLQNANGAQHYRRTMELTQAGKARLVSLMIGSGRPGQQSGVQSSDDLRYPTEFDPPGKATDKAVGAASETRCVGESMDFTFSPNQEQKIEFSVTRTLFRGFREIGWPIGDPTIPQPDFQVQRLEGTAQLKAGEVALLGTMNPLTNQEGEDKAEGEVWFVFGRAFRREPTQIQPAAQRQSGYGGLIQYSIFSLERALVQELLKNGEPGEQGMVALMQLVGEKRARLEHLATIPASPGKRASSSGIREFRVASEWSPPSTGPKVLKATEKRIVTSSESSAGESRAPRSSSTTTESQKEILPDAGDRMPGYPTAFETANLGIQIQHDIIGNEQSKSLEVRLYIRDQRVLGDAKHPESISTTPPHAVFEGQVCQAVIPVNESVPLLISTLNPPGETGVNGRKDSGQVRIIFAKFIPSKP